ncbi:MAG: mevalonate kinase, partial [Halobacteriota archaeon]
RVVSSIGVVSREGRAAVEAGDVREVGRLMDVNHGLLEALGVSTSRLSELVWRARERGAEGAKLTGAGGGGCVVALGGDLDVDVAWEDAARSYALDVAEGVRAE